VNESVYVFFAFNIFCLFLCISSNLLSSVAAVVTWFHFCLLNSENMCHHSVKGKCIFTDNIICCFVLVSSEAFRSDEG